jgi:hypothetical protein
MEPAGKRRDMEGQPEGSIPRERKHQRRLRELVQLSPRAAGGWQAREAHMSRYLAVRWIALLGASLLARVLELRVNQAATHLKQLDDLLHHSRPEIYRPFQQRVNALDTIPD